MPANLTPQYQKAEQIFKQATTTVEKLAALEEMLRVIPKHKGTEKLQADIKRRMSKLRDQAEKKGGGESYDPYVVPREGAAQVVLVGAPNTGKSALVGSLTRAKVTVAEFPYATPLPIAGMMPYEDIQIQLVDTPPVNPEGLPPGMAGTLRRADALLIRVNAASDDCLEDLEAVLQPLQDRDIVAFPAPRETSAEAAETDAPEDGTDQGVGKRGAGNAPPQPRRTESDPLPLEACLLVAVGADQSAARENLTLLKELIPAGLDMLLVSTVSGEGYEQLQQRIFRMAGIIRVYSKAPGKPADMEKPFVLRHGETALDMAAAVHRDFPERLRGARVWGSARFDGQSVPKDHLLEDGDVVELQV